MGIWSSGMPIAHNSLLSFFFFEITTYLLVVWPKFKLSTCDLKFDILPI